MEFSDTQNIYLLTFPFCFIEIAEIVCCLIAFGGCTIFMSHYRNVWRVVHTTCLLIKDLKESIYLFLKIYLFAGKSDIQRGGETEKKIFHLMIHSPSECNSRWYADPKSGARNFFWVSHMGARSQSFGPTSTAFTGHRQGAGWEVELLGLEPPLIWDPSAFKVRTLAAAPCRQATLFI